MYVCVCELLLHFTLHFNDLSMNNKKIPPLSSNQIHFTVSYALHNLITQSIVLSRDAGVNLVMKHVQEKSRNNWNTSVICHV
jgi:hypothetical protein